jgi:hypothetical protein
MSRMRSLRSSLVVAALIAAASPSAAQTSTATLADLAFMSGCWRGSFGDGGIIEEHYSLPSTNMMIGMTRYTRGGRVVDFEFTRIQQDSGKIVIVPHPKGVRSVAFVLRELRDRRAVWENLEHDFPQRIIYRASPEGGLVARIEGKTSKGDEHQEWTMTRAECGK